MFGERLNSVRYVGADISTAVDVAAERCAKRGIDGRFIQCDLMLLPFAPQSIDVIFSEGVLHHTDSTRDALLRLARQLRTGGRFMFHVDNRKGPIREFTDDSSATACSMTSPEEAWQAVLPLTKLGATLGELDLEIDVPSRLPRRIPAGANPQRLFYWHLFKAITVPIVGSDEPRQLRLVRAKELTSACWKRFATGARVDLTIEREVIEPVVDHDHRPQAETGLMSGAALPAPRARGDPVSVDVRRP